MSKKEFEAIYNQDGTCHACGFAGIVLAYDEFSPEIANWYCAQCWAEYLDANVPFLTIAEDKRKDYHYPLTVDMVRRFLATKHDNDVLGQCRNAVYCLLSETLNWVYPQCRPWYVVVGGYGCDACDPYTLNPDVEKLRLAFDHYIDEPTNQITKAQLQACDALMEVLREDERQHQETVNFYKGMKTDMESEDKRGLAGFTKTTLLHIDALLQIKYTGIGTYKEKRNAQNKIIEVHHLYQSGNYRLEVKNVFDGYVYYRETVTRTDGELLVKAKKACNDYKVVFGAFPDKIGIEYERIKAFRHQYIRFPEMTRVLPTVLETAEGGSFVDPTIKIHTVNFEPVYGSEFSPDEVYLQTERGVIGGSALAEWMREIDDKQPNITTTTASSTSGTFTYNDFTKLIETLKNGPHHEEPTEILSPDEWRRRSDEAWRKIDPTWGSTDFEPPDLGEIVERKLEYPLLSMAYPYMGDGVIPLNAFDQIAGTLKTECSISTNADSWAISQQTYNQIRYLHHLAQLRPLPRRKIRKCYMRKAVQQLRQDKKRARRRYGLV